MLEIHFLHTYTYFNVSHSVVAFLLVPLAINILNFYWIHTELINIVGSFGDTYYQLQTTLSAGFE